MCSWPLSAWSSRSAASLSSLTDLPTTLTTSSRWRFFPSSQNLILKGTYWRVQATARSSQWAATLCEVQHQHSSSSILCTFLGICCEVDLKDCFLAVVAVNQADMVLHATTCGAVIAGVTCWSMFDSFSFQLYFLFFGKFPPLFVNIFGPHN